MKSYEVIVVGGGGAGLTAAIYTSRAKLLTVIFEKLVAGGQIATTDMVENYPGFPDGLIGPDIAQRFEEQAKRYGTEFRYDEIQSIHKSASGFEIRTRTEAFEAKSVIIASGASYRKLAIPGESELVGKGVSYCATCDGAFFKGKEVVVVGGGDSALQEGLFLTRFAAKVTIVHRRDQLRASQILQERAKQNQKIQFIWDTVIDRIKGEKKVSAVDLRNVKSGRISEFKTDGVFVFIGHEPNTKFLQGVVALDSHGYVVTNLPFETSVSGIFAAGEVRAGAVKQLVAACGEGCGAALAAQHYIENL